MNYGQKLQEAILVATLISTVFGGAYVFYTAFSAPNYSHGIFYQTAWLVYGDQENTVYYEFPFGDMVDAVPAFAEVIKKTAVVMPINYRLRSRPLVVVAMTRPTGDTQLMEMGRFTIYPDDIYTIGMPPHQNKEWRYSFFRDVWERGVARKDYFMVAHINETSGEVRYTKQVFKRDSRTFKAMVAELNSSRMQLILDRI